MADSRLVDAERATKTATSKNTRVDIFVTIAIIADIVERV